MTSKLRMTAMNLLARREHSRLELAKKLRKRDYESSEIDDVLSALENENLLSDQRFSEAYANMRANRGLGPVRIRLELNDRGVADNLISAALARHESSWFERAEGVRQKKFGDPPENIEAKAKQLRFLQYRGFTNDQIREVLD